MSDEADENILEYLSVPVKPGFSRLGPFLDLLEANLTKTKLLERGIESSILGENQAATLGPIYGMAYGGIFLLVAKDDLTLAKIVVREMEQLRKQRMDRESAICPKCRSSPGDRCIPMIRWIGLLSIFIGAWADYSPIDTTVHRLLFFGIGVFLLFKKSLPEWKCRACKRRFLAPIPEERESD